MRILILDDSPAFRRYLAREIEGFPGAEVVGLAGDPHEAFRQVQNLRPDLLTVDLELPHMDGISFLNQCKLPSIVISSLADEGGAVWRSARASGALAVMRKPRAGEDPQAFVERLRVNLQAAAILVRRPSSPAKHEASLPVVTSPPGNAPRLIALGSSTGGPETLASILPGLPASIPPLLIAQHMPRAFTGQMAARLDSLCNFAVREARDGEALQPGVALIAPGDEHLVVSREAGALVARLRKGPKVHHQRPSVDVLFHSVAQMVGARAIGVLLTGMGRDGAEGLLAMRQAGARTLAQDEASSVVYGMPRVAAELGAAEEVVPMSCMHTAIARAAGLVQAA